MSKIIERNVIQEAYVKSTRALRFQHEGATQFGEVLTAGRTPIIELNSAYGTSALRDIVELTGSASKDDVNGSITSGEIELSTGATASSRAAILSAEIARYIPGYSAEFGLGVRLPTAPTGEQRITWGGHTQDRNNGIYFKYDASGLSVVREKGGTEVDVIAQADWNLDPLDGTGPSGYTLDPSKGNIYQINYTWYGYGEIRFSVIGTVSDAKQRPIPVHVMTIGTFSVTSLNNPSLQVFADVENNATASDLTFYVGGRQYSIIGNYKPKFRYTGDTRSSLSVSTSVIPAIAFRFKDGFRNRSIKLDGYSIINSGNQPVITEIRIGTTLTGGSWVTPTDYVATDTAVEVNRTATAVSGGNVVYSGDIVAAAKEGGALLATLDVDIPENANVVLCVRSVTGAQTCYAGFRLREEW